MMLGTAKTMEFPPVDMVIFMPNVADANLMSDNV